MDLNKLGDPPYQFSFARPILWLADGPGVDEGIDLFPHVPKFLSDAPLTTVGQVRSDAGSLPCRGMEREEELLRPFGLFTSFKAIPF